MTLASDRASAIFFALSGVPIEERARLLDERCGSDARLRAEVERLLGGINAESSITPVDRAAAVRVEGASFPPGTVVGDFSVVRQIGAGGAGAADRRRYLGGQPIAASPDSARYMARRQVVRYRLALAACVVTIAVVTALAAYANWQRTRGNWVNTQLEKQLSANTVERGRMVSITGNHPVAEDLVWRELFRYPESRHTRWTLWDIYSREPSLWTKIEHETGTQTIRFSPDNRLLLTAGRVDGELHLLDAERGDLIRRFVTEPRSGTMRMAFTPDGATIVAGTADGSIHVWDAATGALRRSLKSAVPGLRDVGLSSNGRHAVALGTDGLSVVGLTDADRHVRSAYQMSSASALATHVASAFAVIGASDGTVTAVDVTRGSRLWQVDGHQTEVISLAVSPDGRSVVSGGIDGSIGFWSAETGRACARCRGRLGGSETCRSTGPGRPWRSRASGARACGRSPIAPRCREPSADPRA